MFAGRLRPEGDMDERGIATPDLFAAAGAKPRAVPPPAVAPPSPPPRREPALRPQILNPLFKPANSLPGVGPKIAKLFEKVAGERVVDVLWHLPVGIIDRSYSPQVRDALPGSIATLRVRVDAHQPGRSPRQPYRVRCSDETGFLHLVFFHAKGDYLTRLLPVARSVSSAARSSISTTRSRSPTPTTSSIPTIPASCRRSSRSTA
jgi:hypothetical protein